MYNSFKTVAFPTTWSWDSLILGTHQKEPGSASRCNLICLKRAVLADILVLSVLDLALLELWWPRKAALACFPRIRNSIQSRQNRTDEFEMDDSEKHTLADHSEDESAQTDMEAWILSTVSSVSLVLTNKQIMSVYDFRFASTLTALQFLSTTILGFVSSRPTVNSSKHVPIWEVIAFATVSNVATVAMNLSLMLNPMGFYQIAKLSIVPTVCLLGWIFNRKTYSRDVKIALFVVMLGVGVCAVSDADLKSGGLIAAGVAIVFPAFQKFFICSMQEKYNIGFVELMVKATPVQAVSLIVLGPIVDYILTGVNVWDYKLSYGATFFVVLSCTLAVASNMIRYLFVARFSATSYTALGHMKGSLILILGWVFFNSQVNLKTFSGMIVAIFGVVLYSWSTAGTKEPSGPLGSFNMSEADVARLKSLPDVESSRDVEIAGPDLR